MSQQDTGMADTMAALEEWLGPGMFKALGPYLVEELGVEEVDDMKLLDPEHLETCRGKLKPSE